jgi:hypothetical protein
VLVRLEEHQSLVLVEAAQPRVPPGSSKGGQFASTGGGGHASITGSSKPERAALNKSTRGEIVARTSAQLGMSERPWQDGGAVGVAAKHTGTHEVGKRLDANPAYQKGLQTEGGMFVQGEMEGNAHGINGYSGGTAAHPHSQGMQFTDGAQDMWAQTASGSQTAADFQYAAKAEFGVGSTKHLPLQARGSALEVSRNRLSATELADRQGVIRAYHRSRYDDTQAHLASLGMQPTDRVTLFRGTGSMHDASDPFSADAPRELERSGAGRSRTTTVELAPLSSWSNNFVTASSFGGSVMAASFPVSRIYGISTRGSGAHNEGEVIVLGSPAHGFDTVAFT